MQRYPFVTGVKTGHTLGAGYVLVGSGTAGGGRVITVTLGAPSESARDADTLALLRWGLEQFRRERVVSRGKPLAELDVNYRDEDAPVGAARPVTLVLRTGEKATTALDAPDELDGPLAKGDRVGWVEVKRDGETVRRVPLVTLAEVEGASFLRKVARVLGTLLIVAIVLVIVLLVFVAVRRGGEGMIITVTLNAAVDKTLAVPNFRIGRRHRAVEQTSMAGGKGVNVARALKTLGQPVIATGVAGGPTGTRIIEQLTDEATLNDFVRIRDESRTSTAVVDDTTGEQTEINEHGPAVSEPEIGTRADLRLRDGGAVLVDLGLLARRVVHHRRRCARLLPDADEVVQDRLVGQLLDDARPGRPPATPVAITAAERLQRTRHVDALAACHRGLLDGPMAASDAEVRHRQCLVDRCIQRDGDDHSFPSSGAPQRTQAER